MRGTVLKTYECADCNTAPARLTPWRYIRATVDGIALQLAEYVGCRIGRPDGGLKIRAEHALQTDASGIVHRP